MITNKDKTFSQTLIIDLESLKIKKLLKNPILKDLTVIFSSPKDLIFDIRSQYCCKIKCSNYSTRCFCPPYSLKLQKCIKNKNLVIIFIKTYDFSELNHFKNNPEDFHKDYIFKRRIFVRRWVQSEFYKKIKAIFNEWGLNSEDIFAGGFSNTNCKKCYRDGNSLIRDMKCIPMPSPEALGIDVKRSLEKMNYFIKFGVMQRMTKVSMLFTTIPQYTEYLNLRLDGNDKPYDRNILKEENLIKQLKCRFKSIEFKQVDVRQLLSKIKEEYHWLKNWNNAILWKSNKRSKIQVQNEIHKFIFMKNHYFALDFNTQIIFKEHSKYNGIEFY